MYFAGMCFQYRRPMQKASSQFADTALGNVAALKRTQMDKYVAILKASNCAYGHHEAATRLRLSLSSCKAFRLWEIDFIV